MPITKNSKTMLFLTHYWPITFIFMVLSFLVFGALSVNLAQTFVANIQFISEHGYLALADGALFQLLGLLLTASLAVGCYVVFKTCESVLVQRILAGKP